MSENEVRRAMDLSFQDRADPEYSDEYGLGGADILSYLVQAGDLIPPWWSTARDIELRRFWKKPDHLSGAVRTVTNKAATLQFRVVPKDRAVKVQNQMAEEAQQLLLETPEYGLGWNAFMIKWVQDLLCLAGPTKVHLGGDRRGKTKSIAQIVKDCDFGPVLSVDASGHIVERNVTEWHKSPLGSRQWWWISLKDASGHSKNNRGGIFMTDDHPVLTDRGWLPAQDVRPGMMAATGDPSPSDAQAEVLVGGMLGDMGVGIVRKRAMLRFSHSVKQEEWLDFKLGALTGFQWTGRNIRKSEIGGYEAESVSLNSRSSLGLTAWRNDWYPSGKKIVARDYVERYFSPRMMAVWFCDDGTLHHNKTRAGNETSPSAVLYTNGFTVKDVEWLSGFLCGKGIECRVRKQKGKNGKSYPIIYITTNGTRSLISYIGSYVPPSMRYKVPEFSSCYDPSLWDIEGAHAHYDEVIESRQRDYSSGYRVVGTTYHIGVDETRNFVAANTVVHNTQDNGAFAEIIGPGRPDGPRLGKPISLAHLDSSRCMRTRDPEFPVIYQDTNGKRYKMHYTRVMYSSQMTSSNVEMNGIGFCSVSSAINTAQNLLDISTYKQEKLGSRPLRQMLIGSNISAEEILSALIMAEESMDNRSLERYAPIVAIGNKRKEIGLEQIDLASIPDGFDEETSTTLGMFTIALAFETDARDLWPATVSGATKADAMVQHLKSRGRGQGQTMQIIARQINQKFLPPTLHFEFNAQDDEQDMIQAEVRDQRSKTWDRDILNTSLTIRVAREQMLDKGDITREQFIQMELDSRRLQDGTPLLTLFFSDDPAITPLLDLKLDNPLNIRDNSADAALREIDKAIMRAFDFIASAQGQVQKKNGREALAALENLKEEYEEIVMQEEIAEAERLAQQAGSTKRPRTTSDRQDIRNEDDFRGDGSRSAVRSALGKK